MPRPFFDFVMHHVGADALIGPLLRFCIAPLVGADAPVRPSPPQREPPLYEERGVIANGDRGEFVKRFSLSHLR